MLSARLLSEDAMMDYFNMGGYAAWIWPSYALVTIGVVGVLVTTLRSLKARTREFEALKSARRGGENA